MKWLFVYMALFVGVLIVSAVLFRVCLKDPDVGNSTVSMSYCQY